MTGLLKPAKNDNIVVGNIFSVLVAEKNICSPQASLKLNGVNSLQIYHSTLNNNIETKYYHSCRKSVLVKKLYKNVLLSILAKIECWILLL